MRTLLAFVLAATLATAQRPPGFVRGEVTENTALSFAVRTSAGDIYRYRADARTWIERDHERIRAASLAPGEILEVVSDRDPDPVRYARMVHVIQPVMVRKLPSPPAASIASSPPLRFPPPFIPDTSCLMTRNVLFCERASTATKPSICRATPATSITEIR